MAKREILNNDAVTVRVGEEVVDVVEDVVEKGKAIVMNTADAVLETGEVVGHQVERVITVTKNNPLVLAAVFVVGAGIGGYAAYKYFGKKLERKYQDELDEQIEAAKDFYKRTNKAEEFESPESAVKALVPDEVVDTVRTYQGREKPKQVSYNKPEQVDPRPPVTTVVEEKIVTQNVFVQSATDPRDWDYNAELQDRALRQNNEPYVISFEEFNENEEGHDQNTLTYYVEDKVLADEQEKPIDNVEYTIGDENLERFGHGSHDSNVVYVRNERIGTDFEVVRSHASYKVAVLGLDDEDEAELQHSHRRPNRRHWRSSEE